MAVITLPPEIHDLEDYTESQNWLIYGPTGVGKTRLIGQLPDNLILAAEHGTIAAKRGGSKAKVWVIRHWDDLVNAYEWLANNNHPFKWVTVDSATIMQYKAIRGIMEKVVESNETRDPDIPAKGDHFKWQLIMKRMVSDFNDLDVNMLWTAQQMQREDQEGKDIILPLIEGKDYDISAWVCGTMNVVAHYGFKSLKVRGSDDVKIVRRLTTAGDGHIYAKDRYDLFGHHVDDPNLADLVARVDASMIGKPAATRRVAKKAPAKKATAASRVARKRTSA